MKTFQWTAVLTVFYLGVASTPAQESENLNGLRKQLQDLQETFRRVQAQQQQQIESLQRQLDSLQTKYGTNAVTAAAAPPLAASPPELESAKPEVISTPKWTPTSALPLLGNQRNYLNLSLDGLFTAGTSTASDIDRLELGGHDPSQRGFTLQNLEAVFEGKIDPYFRGQANVVLQIDSEGETVIEAEEAYLETMALPGNLQLKAGQFFTEFGRLNPTHPHSWDFVDQPIVNGRFLGGDGLRSAGARLSWLLPTPFYSELLFAVANSQGETAFSFRNEHEGAPFFGRPASNDRVKTVGDMLFVPRYVASFDLTDSQTLMAGASAAFGPNSSGSNADTQIYGVDLFWKWKSPHQNAGFPFVTWQTEAMMRRFQAGEFPGDATVPPLPSETLVDFGMYSQVAYGFRKGWVSALRWDYVFPEEAGEYERVLGTDWDRATRWRIAPNLTWYPSEFSKVRLQYNFDHRQKIGDDHSVWLQLEFLLGSHAAHNF